jgi:hypothetical protein
MPVLSNQRHEAVAQAYIADPERIGWKAYKQVYPNSSQYAAETGFSRLLLKNAEFASRLRSCNRVPPRMPRLLSKVFCKKRMRISALRWEPDNMQPPMVP